MLSRLLPPLGQSRHNSALLAAFGPSSKLSSSKGYSQRKNQRKKIKKKERKRTTQGRDGRTARRHHTGILRRGVWCASRRPPLGVRLFLSLFAVLLRFSLQPSCHLAVAPFSSWSPLSLLPLSRRSPALLCLVLRRRRRLPLPCSRCSAQLCPPCCISWPLESIELSSSKDESSDAHCDHAVGEAYILIRILL